MDQGRLAAHQKKASRLKAHLVFLDESGFLLAPLVRRSWAPRGQTPVLLQAGRHREKASAIAALSVSPRRRRVGLHFSVAPGRNVDGDWLVNFLRDLRRHLRGQIVLLWDRLGVHRARLVTDYRHRCRRKLHIEWLPPYAPELNPVEPLWGHSKINALANLAPHDAPHLAHLARLACRVVRRAALRGDLLRAFLRSTPLSLRFR